MTLAFLKSTELFTLPWLALMLIGLTAPVIAIAVALARFGQYARWRAAALILIVDGTALILAMCVHGDNPFPVLTVELAPVGIVVAAITVFCHARPLPPNICRVCGYDLRATPDRCPECNATVLHSAP